jgi:hypothetical protein
MSIQRDLVRDTYTEDVPELHHEVADVVTNLFLDDPIEET